jgi:hypothetical protein
MANYRKLVTSKAILIKLQSRQIKYILSIKLNYNQVNDVYFLSGITQIIFFLKF